MASRTPTPARPTPSRRSSYLTPSLHSDAGSIHSTADTDSDDDSVLRDARTSAEIRAHDRRLLVEEEEREGMLMGARLAGKGKERRGSGFGIGNPFRKFGGRGGGEVYDPVGGNAEGLDGGGSSGAGKREARRLRREEKKVRLVMAAAAGEDRGLLYEMEEGDMKSGSETGDSSDMEGFERGEKAHLHDDDEYTGRRRWGWKIWTYITVLLLLFIALLVLVSWRLSIHSTKPKHDFKPVREGYSSNGTALFKPTTILISLDGFRADYLNRALTPALSRFISQGISAPYMTPSFPSLTFPNHYTLITGLHPESHGIVANKFWDPSLGKEFQYTDPTKSRQREWWSQAEPLWVTAEKAGVRTAIHMWPGSEAAISDTLPGIVDAYQGKQPLEEKLERVFDMLDMPGAESNETEVSEQRPQFIATYVPNIDAVGHKFGPDSAAVNASLIAVDAMLANLFKGIEARNLTDIVNIVIVSDHGMAESSNDRLIQIDKILDMDLLEHVDGWPLYGLRPVEPITNNVLKLYKRLMMAEVEYGHVFEVYQKEHMPERWHFTNNERIAPLWIIPKTGWAFVTKGEFDVEAAKESGKQYAPKGIHGYDNEDPLMRAIFAARGPAFKEWVGKEVQPFQNTEVYNIICDSLYLTPRPNNGTLNLFRQAPVAPSPSTSLSSSPAISSAISSLSSALSSASTDVHTSSTSTTTAVTSPTTTTAEPNNPLNKPAVSISEDVSSMSKAWESAASVVVDRPVISETAAAVVPSAVVATPSKSAGDVPVEGETEGKEDEDEEFVDMPEPQPAAQGEQDEEEQEDGGGGESGGSGGWWDWVKTKVGDAKDWVTGLLPGGGSDDADEKSE